MASLDTAQGRQMAREFHHHPSAVAQRPARDLFDIIHCFADMAGVKRDIRAPAPVFGGKPCDTVCKRLADMRGKFLKRRQTFAKSIVCNLAAHFGALSQAVRQIILRRALATEEYQITARKYVWIITLIIQAECGRKA
ncbi:MAG: hypothetical protein ACK5JM_06470 [Rhodoblastus sp.]